MKLKCFIGVVILFLGFLQTSYGQKLKTAKYAGVYSFGKNVETGPIGSITIYPESDTTILFYVDICRGAPSYNLGELYGRLEMKNGKATFYSKEALDEKGCKWQILINDRILTIKTLDQCEECGFGANVYADNQYTRREGKIPSYFVNGHNQKVYFNKTSPENYER